MKTSSNWPIVPPSSHLLTIADLKAKCGLTTGGGLRKWIIKQGFSFALARMSEGNQLTLVVTPEEWQKIKARREALGYVVR